MARSRTRAFCGSARLSSSRRASLPSIAPLLAPSPTPRALRSRPLSCRMRPPAITPQPPPPTLGRSDGSSSRPARSATMILQGAPPNAAPRRPAAAPPHDPTCAAAPPLGTQAGRDSTRDRVRPAQLGHYQERREARALNVSSASRLRRTLGPTSHVTRHRRDALGSRSPRLALHCLQVDRPATVRLPMRCEVGFGSVEGGVRESHRQTLVCVKERLKRRDDGGGMTD